MVTTLRSFFLSLFAVMNFYHRLLGVKQATKGFLLFWVLNVFWVGVQAQGFCNQFIKKEYLTITEYVPAAGTRLLTTIVPVATAVSGKVHWYVGYGNGSGGSGDGWVVRTNDTGKVLSAVRFGVLSNKEVVTNIRTTPTGGAVVVGSTYVSGITSDLGFASYFGNNGKLKWTARTASVGRVSNSDVLNNVYIADANRFLVVGSGLQLTGKRNVIATMLDSSGNTVWNHNIDLGNTEQHGVDASKVGNEWVVTGWARSTQTYPFAIFIKSSGGVRKIWKGNTVGTNTFGSVVVGSNGTIYTAGTAGGAFGSNVLVSAFRADGYRKWTRSIGGVAASEVGHHIELDGANLWISAAVQGAPSREMLAQIDTASGATVISKIMSNGNTSYVAPNYANSFDNISAGGTTSIGLDAQAGAHFNIILSNPCENLCGISSYNITNNSLIWGWDTTTYTVNLPGDFPGITFDTVSFATNRTINCQSACPLPVKTLKPDYLLCTGSPSVTINATQPLGVSYQWSDGSTAASKVFTTAQTVYVNTTNPCGTIKDTVNIVAASAPSKPNLKDTLFCSTPISHTIDVAQNYCTYVWDNGSTLSSRTFTKMGTYWLETKNSCGFRVDTLKLKLILKPVSLKLKDTVVCSGKSVVVDFVKLSPNLYTWNDGDTMVPKTFSSKQQVILDISNQCGTALDTFDIDVRFPPSKAKLKDTTFCARPFSWSVDVTQPYATGYQWSDGFTSPVRTINFTGKYYLLTQNNCGTRIDSVQVFFDTLPLDVFTDTAFWFCRGDKYTIKAYQPFGNFKYEWSTGAKTPEITVGASGNYWVKTYNNCGNRVDNLRAFAEVGGNCNCKWFMPNAFTPYGSRGLNDEVKPMIYCGVKEGYWSVYTRWGECVFDKRPLTEAWDGSYNGELVPEGMYIYLIHAIFDETVMGYRNLDAQGTILLISGKK